MDTLQTLYDRGLISDLDLHFTRFITDLANDHSEGLTLATLLVSYATNNGNICAHLPSFDGQPLFDSDELGSDIIGLPWSQWQPMLRDASVVGNPGEVHPLILDQHGRLYLYRYWQYEQHLAVLLRQRAQTIAIDRQQLRAELQHLFPANKEQQPDWQMLATATAVLRLFSVISGGPGTGKTTTVIRILALLLALYPALRIALAAPTGKAAARMQEAIQAAKMRLPIAENLRCRIPEQATTIHRLLGPIGHSVYFQHDSVNRLAIDVLVVDEASMVDLALMTKLTAALPDTARLILLGDKDQLASVESGAVLGDICQQATGFSLHFAKTLLTLTGVELNPEDLSADNKSMNDSIVLLRQSYRFAHDSGIGALAHAVNSGDANAAIRVLHDGDYPDVGWQNIEPSKGLPRELLLAIAKGFEPYLKSINDAEPLATIIEQFNRFRILCALRGSETGVDAINRLTEQVLQNLSMLRIRAPWYIGRPIMITRNDYSLNLYNGDIGLTLPDADDQHRLKVFFPTATDDVRKIAPNRLSNVETCYAMTVHKSQGSEFNKVLLLLPQELSRVLNRELVYTAVTRARSAVEIWGREALLVAAINKRLQRASGLSDRLWSTP